MRMNWNKELLRDGEGGGSGGGGTGDAASTSSDPSNDRMSAIEKRLDRITGALDTMSTDTKTSKLQGAIAARDKELADAHVATETTVSDAEKRLADAYDNGEGVEIAKAQRALTEAVAKRERADIALNDFRAQVKAAEKKRAEAPKGGDGDDTNLNAWKSKHASWYGVDAEMTKASHEIDRQIRAAGVISVGSKDYFDAVDKQMAAKYPEKFGGTPPTGGAGGGPAPTSTASRGKIQASIADGWRRMGIDMSNPETVDRMLKNREKAVQKGILPSEPVTGPVVTR